MADSLTYAELKEFYFHLGETYSAGIPLSELLHEAPLWVKGHNKDKLKILGHTVRQGKTLSEGMKRSGVFSRFDIQIMNAAELSGKLGPLAIQLSHRYEQRDLLKKNFLKKLVYPMFLLTLGLCLFSLPDLVAGKINLVDYLRGSVGVIVILLIVVYVFTKIYLNLANNLSYERMIYNFQKVLPMIGSAIKKIALSDYFYSLALMIEAGIPVVDATREASKVGHHWAMKKAGFAVFTRLSQGQALAASFAVEKFFPRKMISYIKTGEDTGNLAKAFGKIAETMGAEADGALSRLANLIPKIIYGLVVAAVAYNIIQTFMNLSPIFEM